MINRYTCDTCRHEGCCEYLDPCGGSHWESAYANCAQCDKTIRIEDAVAEDKEGNLFCSDECLSAWDEERREDGEEVTE